MALKSGSYAVRTVKKVVVWPKADKNGDGAEVWVSKLDDLGRQVARERARDDQGHEVYEYAPPDGFQNRPGYDHSDNYVMVTERGEIARTPTGEAIGIHPGEALVFEPDGSITVLKDEWEQYLFVESHDTVTDDVAVEKTPVKANKTKES